MSFVYLLHFNPPLHHARHYIGFAKTSVERRIRQHQQGTGAALTKAAIAAGIQLELARIWEGNRSLERQLKNLKNAPRLCPICQETFKNVQAKS
ncbi:MAG TPA: GIY-YIG nuclease family protein [Stenomitos sp.]